VYTGDYSPYRRRVHGRPAPGVAGSRFVVFLHNHDQIGNRAVGERKHHMAGMTMGRAKIGAALTLLSPFVPLLFQGEEWAASAPFQFFTDHEDPALGAAVSEGRRREFASFGWAPEDVPDPQALETFTRSHLDWEEVGAPEHADMLAWYRRLIELRRRLPVLSDGRRDQVIVAFDEQEQWLAFTRPPVTVAVNLGASVASVPRPYASGAYGTLAVSDPGVKLLDGRVVLPPDSAAVVMEAAASTTS
jgi:maltooligosyltrehalose trehalohydrolase